MGKTDLFDSAGNFVGSAALPAAGGNLGALLIILLFAYIIFYIVKAVVFVLYLIFVGTYRGFEALFSGHIIQAIRHFAISGVTLAMVITITLGPLIYQVFQIAKFSNIVKGSVAITELITPYGSEDPEGTFGVPTRLTNTSDSDMSFRVHLRFFEQSGSNSSYGSEHRNAISQTTLLPANSTIDTMLVLHKSYDYLVDNNEHLQIEQFQIVRCFVKVTHSQTNVSVDLPLCST